jgi:YHS domain-containing protein
LLLRLGGEGTPAFFPSLWGDEWERRKIRNRIHLTFTGCLGPCAVGNNALLQIHGRSLWFKDLNDARLVPMVFDYVEAMLSAGRVLSPPASLADHLFERYAAPPTEQTIPGLQTPTLEDALDRLCPVCLMEVDVATARHTMVYEDRLIGFCAPSCKREFRADPAAYTSG